MAEETRHQLKSPAARQQALAAWLDLQNHPLGTERGENFSVPTNYRIPPARIYVINHSRTMKWKRIVVPVSSRRGAEEALIYDKELAKIYNVDTLYRAIDGGRDMNRYKAEIHPVIFSFKVGAPMGGLKPVPPVTYAIPPARNAESAPPRVEVLEGSWDLFLGNYDRMRSEDPMVLGEEKSRLSIRWRSRHNPVMRFTDDGVSTNIDNEYGFLEFVRETQKQVMEPMDKEYLQALDLMEA